MSEFETFGVQCLRSRNLMVQDALSRRQIDAAKIPPLERAYRIVVTGNDGFLRPHWDISLQSAFFAGSGCTKVDFGD